MDGLTVETLEAAETEILESLKRGFAKFVAAGQRLEQIRDSMLWNVDFPSFEAYALTRFDLKTSHVYGLIAASKVTLTLSAAPEKCNPEYQTPESERLCRELAPLLSEPEKLRTAWKRAVEAADGGQVTFSKVRAAVRQITMPPASEEQRDLDSMMQLEWPQGVEVHGQHTAELLPVPRKNRQMVLDEAVKLADEKATKHDGDPKITSSIIRQAAKAVAEAASTPIPLDSPEWVHANRSIFDQMVMQLTTLRNEIAQVCKSPVGQYVDENDLDSSLKYVLRALRDAKPYSVCPDCRGRSEDREDCTRCNVNLDSGSGWVSRLKHRLASKDSKIGLEKWT